MRTFEGRSGEVNCTPIDRLTVHKCIAGGHRYRGGIMRVNEIEVVDVCRVHEIDVVNPRVHDVDVIDEYSAAPEAGEERIAKTQWEPANPATKAEPEPKVAATEEADESRAKNRPSEKRTGAPTPCAANE